MHKTIWFKIHWILGITAGIILLIVGVTGAILSFEKEIMKAINSDSYYVKVIEGQDKLTTKELLEKFQASNPKAKINSISFSLDKESSTVINVASEGARRGLNIYINPYTAEVLPDLVGKDFFGFILRLHRWLAFPQEIREVGKQTVAISTVALIVLIISGIIVYWGRIKHAFFKSFTFKFKHKGRAFLSTMHSAIGMWVIPFYLLAALTGLYWSYGWYNNMLYSIAGVEKPQRQQAPQPQTQKESKSEEQKVEGQKERKTEGQRAERAQGQRPQGETSSSKFVDIQKAVEMFNIFVQRDYSSVTLRFPQKGTIYSFSYLDTDPAHYRARNTLEVDINSWQLLKHERYNDLPLNERLMKSILPLHTGEYFGLIGQIGMFIASALMALFTITGFMLYINRHKKKKPKIQQQRA
ncbi:PepSY-associated TM helix domain-containing protein [Arcobacter aquimarinus]|uniref:Sulfite reductase, flavoprotein component n=1 Tax=Arcobacter aquimarinus TaxID=1315211 RepID=A0AAE7B129_9BACT|nr:PepSY-associated TM helix domain-containing protein [Arcobacter aquimarinus]MCB9097387.1 PepSY domain-containing protein [Arcobacter sp.]QKE25543.1 sulfite reductase, flavoprotein component [Arcobacter aquimarinus]RXI32637.1 sulfite reductase [Arcobacter aquimarinus]